MLKAEIPVGYLVAPSQTGISLVEKTEPTNQPKKMPLKQTNNKNKQTNNKKTPNKPKTSKQTKKPNNKQLKDT